MKEYSRLEIDIEAMVFRHEDFPNDKKEIARLLGVTEKKITDVLQDSDVYVDREDGYIRKKLYEDQIGKYQLVFPLKKECNYCGRMMKVKAKSYVSDDLTTMCCQSCQKKKTMIDGLETGNEPEPDDDTRIGFFGATGSGKSFATKSMVQRMERNKKVVKDVRDI